MKTTKVISMAFVFFFISTHCYALSDRIKPGISVLYGSPIGFSGELDCAFAFQQDHVAEGHWWHGPVIETGLGTGGGKIGIGYEFKTVAAMIGGFGISGTYSFVQSWWKPVKIETDETYKGYELELLCTLLMLKVGRFSQIDGDDEVTTFAMGIHF